MEVQFEPEMIYCNYLLEFFEHTSVYFVVVYVSYVSPRLIIDNV